MNERILVVDDEEVMRLSLADILRLEGYRVDVLSSGAEAVDVLGDVEYDLLIVDLKMPGIDGLEVMRAASRKAPDTMVILLTAHGSLPSAIEAIRENAYDYLLKPSSPEQILHSVRGALQKRAEARRKQALIDQIDASIQQLRQPGQREIPTTPLSAPVVLAGGIYCDHARRELWQGQVKTTLTLTEGKLLKVLLDHRGEVLSHRELVKLVQGYDVKDWEAPEMLRPLVSRLRQKLAVFPEAEKWIENVRGAGYVLDFEE